MDEERKKAELLEAFAASMRGERIPRRYRKLLSSPPDEEIEGMLRLLRFVRENFRESEFTPPRPGALDRIERAILESIGAGEDESGVSVDLAVAPAYGREPHGSDSELVQQDYGYDGEGRVVATVKLKIISNDGTEEVRSVELPLSGEADLVIGRGAEADIRIPDTSRKLSRKHAALRFEEGRIMILDLESTNGTFLNGRRIQSAPISEGDVIRMGSIRIEVIEI
ncbi:TPA: FHA domain-containing protein [Candidatus Poribacteria bacterium]|nr:FHA domain-containing protein [Candidatus Poribacteria bacterium]